jgi:hypothetical protein
MQLLSPLSTLASRLVAHGRGWLLVLIGASALALSPSGKAAVPAATDEYDIKVVFLLNFARFVEWPDAAEPGRPLVIGVVGKDPFGDRLDKVVRGENVAGRPLVVKRFQRIDEVANCDLLFISRSEKPNLGKIMERLEGHAVFTVSDIPEFAENGGMIGLVRDEDKIRLHINVGASKKAANFIISAKLLRLAQIVNTQSQFRPLNRSELYAFELPFLLFGGV